MYMHNAIMFIFAVSYRLESKSLGGSGAASTKSSKHKSHVSTESSSGPSKSVARVSRSGDDEINPFSFSSLSKMMSQQDQWRRDPCPANIDLGTLGNGVRRLAATCK